MKDKEEREEQQRQFQKHMADANRGLDYTNFYNNPYGASVAMQNIHATGAGLMVQNQVQNQVDLGVQNQIDLQVQTGLGNNLQNQAGLQHQIQNQNELKDDNSEMKTENDGQPPTKRQKVGSGNSDETGVSSKENTSGYISENANKDMPESGNTYIFELNFGPKLILNSQFACLPVQLCFPDYQLNTYTCFHFRLYVTIQELC